MMRNLENIYESLGYRVCMQAGRLGVKMRQVEAKAVGRQSPFPRHTDSNDSRLHFGDSCRRNAEWYSRERQIIQEE